MALSNTQIVVGGGLLAGAAYLYFNPRALVNALESFGMSPEQADDTALQMGLTPPSRPKMPTVGLIGSGASTGAQVGPVGAAVGAAAGFIAWGIMDQGWFRGGWEGVKGNTIRDKFLDQFVQAYYPGAGVEMQYEAMVKALESIGIVGSGEPGSSVPNAGELIRQIYAADSHDEMRQAFASWAAVFARKGFRIAVPQESEY